MTGACGICSNLQPDFLHKLPKGQRAILFANLGDVKASTFAPSPCPECALIWNALSLFKKEWTNTNFDKYVELVIALGKPIRLNWHDDSVQLELFSGYRDGETPDTGDSSSCSFIGPASHVSTHSGSDRCFELVTSWLGKCVQSHSQCVPRSPPPLPKRVLDVGSTSGSDPILVETTGQSGYYVALSYCWGSAQHQSVKTTAQTLEQHKTKVAFQSLSRTLQDAVSITRRLGIQFLWVDALCIIQGDADDWARESSKMASVYLNAYLTISADSSSGCDQGIFKTQTYGVSDQQIPYRDGRLVSVRKAFAQEHDKYSLNIRAGVDPEPILCRAWTLQEAILSNRILHYTTRELVWECNECWYCECGTASGIKEFDEYDDRYFRSSSTLATLPTERIYEHWEQIVMRFTERSMTNERDKLPALAGLATQFATALKLISASSGSHDYLAGIWRSDLVKSLRWVVEDDLYRTAREERLLYQRPKSWRAPSWSWASVEGPINYSPLVNLKSCVEVLEASATPSTVDIYGQVNAGKLTLKGRTTRGLALEILEPQPGDPTTGFCNGRRYAIRHDGNLRTFLPDDPADFKGCTVGLNQIALTCLLVGYIMAKGSLTDREEVFIVLQAKTPQALGATNSRGEVFERVGASLRAYQEQHMSTWKGTPGSSGAVRLFDDALEELVTIV